MSGIVDFLHVRALGAGARRGALVAGNISVACALGRSGVASRKREGDGATPRGRWRLSRLLFRADRLRLLATALPRRAMARNDGWCDQGGDRNYNRPVRLPYGAGHERLWRDDHLYDILVVLDFNRRPRIRNRGSAIFFHVAEAELAPTQGCIAVSARDMRKLLVHCSPRTRMIVW